LQRRFGVVAGLSTIHNALRRIGLRHKKKSLRAAEQDRPDVSNKRRRWCAGQRFMDPARFVFLDETGTATNMTRRHGRSPSGARLVAPAPHRYWHTTTFIAGLRQTGVIAPLVPAHKVAGVRQAIAAAGASLLYLPLYSPDLNPIEQLFAKLKALVRKAAARTRDELWRLTGRLLATVPQANAPMTSSTAAMVPLNVKTL
jgi:hypothetical protein